MSFGGGVHPTGAVVLNLYAEEGENNKIKLGSILGKRVKLLGRSATRADIATGRCPQLVSVVASTAVPVVATALSSAPVAAGRAPRRSPFAAQVAGLTVCRKELVVSDILPGTVAYAKRVKRTTTGSESFKLVAKKHAVNVGQLGEWGAADDVRLGAAEEQPFGLCVSGAKAGSAIDVVLGGRGSAFVVGHDPLGMVN